MSNALKLLSAAVLFTGLTVSSALATNLVITSVQYGGTNLTVTGTCHFKAGTVKVWLQEVTTAAKLKVFTTTGICGQKASTTGQTITFSITSVPTGTYDVYLRQAGVTSVSGGTIVVP